MTLAAQLRHPAAADRDAAASTARTATRATPTSAAARSTECLADVVARFVPYYTETIVPDLQAGKTVLIAAHGNSLRALVKYLDGMSDEDVVALEHPDRHPAALRPRRRPASRSVVGGDVPGPRRRPRQAAAAVASQGAKHSAERDIGDAMPTANTG